MSLFHILMGAIVIVLLLFVADRIRWFLLENNFLSPREKAFRILFAVVFLVLLALLLAQDK